MSGDTPDLRAMAEGIICEVDACREQGVDPATPVVAALQRAVEAEREACARICGDMAGDADIASAEFFAQEGGNLDAPSVKAAVASTRSLREAAGAIRRRVHMQKGDDDER